MKRIIIALAVLMFLVVGCSQAPPAQQAAPEPSQQQTIVVPSSDGEALGGHVKLLHRGIRCGGSGVFALRRCRLLRGLLLR